MNPTPETRVATRAAWLVVLLLAAYPLLGVLITLTSLPSVLVSVPIRAAALGVAIALLCQTPSLPVDARRLAFAALMLLCTLRLGWDSVFARVDGALETLGYFVFTIALPAAALISVPVRSWDEAALSRVLFWWGFVTCVAVMFIDTLGLAGDRASSLRGLTLDTVNSITLSHVAVTTILAGAAMRLTAPERIPLWVLLLAMGLALWVMVTVASRGPMVSLAFCLLPLAIYRPRLRWAAAFILLGGVTALFLGDGLALEKILIVDEDLSTLERLAVQANAIDQFIGNPFFGHAYIEPETMNYPHNLFIEAGMALGVTGLVLVTLIHLFAVGSIVQLFRRGCVLVPCLGVQLLSGALFSGSMYAGPQFWLATAILFAFAVPGRFRGPQPSTTERLTPQPVLGPNPGRSAG